MYLLYPWQNGKKSGAGTIIYNKPDGSSHWREGIWIDNDLRGKVQHYFSPDNRTIIEFWTSEGFYVGQTDGKDIPHGQGTMNFHENEDNKLKYAGNWKHGIKYGYGTFLWKNGDV